MKQWRDVRELHGRQLEGNFRGIINVQERLKPGGPAGIVGYLALFET